MNYKVTIEFEVEADIDVHEDDAITSEVGRVRQRVERKAGRMHADLIDYADTVTVSPPTTTVVEAG